MVISSRILLVQDCLILTEGNGPTLLKFPQNQRITAVVHYRERDREREMVYSESQVWVAELVGTTVFTFVGTGGIANAILPGTKGHGIGFMAIALCFGLGVFLALQFVGHISGFFNPAVALAGAVLGDIGWKRFAICVSAEMVGGFLAALLTWFTYIPHFQPLEILQQSEDRVCDCCDLENNGVALIKQELSVPAYRYVSAGSREKERILSAIQLDKVENSVYSIWHCLKSKIVKRSNSSKLQTKSDNSKLQGARAKHLSNACGPSVRQRIAEDQEVKLTVFCTRPSVRKGYWLYCFWIEFFLTLLLTYGASAISAQKKLAITAAPEVHLYEEGLEPLLIGLLIFALILCGGGTTGPALNPARDLSPRIAHFILPIPGKGPSEWWYAWVPVVAPCAGAVVGGYLNRAMTNMIKSGL